MGKKRPPKQAKHLVAAHGAEQDLQTDEAQASVDTEELVSFHEQFEKCWKYENRYYDRCLNQLWFHSRREWMTWFNWLLSSKQVWSFAYKTSRNLSPLRLS